MFFDYEKMRRKNPQTIDTKRRTGIAEVENVYDAQEARRQAERCLVCHIDTIYDPELCVLCGRCSDVCPEKCLKFVPIDQVDMPEEHKKAAFERYDFADGQNLAYALFGAPPRR